MAFPISIKVDSTHHLGPLKPIWRFFGADEPNYAYMKDGQKLLSALAHLGASVNSESKSKHQVYFRTHNLLTTGDGTPALKWGSTNAYTEDSLGNPKYDWTIIDRIFDTYLERGIKPYVQIGFMPEALSTHPEPYQHHYDPHGAYSDIYTGWTFPPKSFAKWEELVFQWTTHCVQRYGREEVEEWYWEVWNEPNIGYWSGSDEEFLKLHDHAIAAVRRALPTARIGGPEVAEGGVPLLTSFLKHCGYKQETKKPQDVGTVPSQASLVSETETSAKSQDQRLPLDFISFHAKGRPLHIVPQNHARMGISHHLNEITSGFATIASFPELKNNPIIISESDPDGAAASLAPELSYRPSTLYSSYTTASISRLHALASKFGLNLQGVLTWAFEFEDQPYFSNFRVLSTNGIDLAVLNVFKMFAMMGDVWIEAKSDGEYAMERVLKEGVREEGDVGVLASLNTLSTTNEQKENRKETISILIWHYHDDDVSGPTATINLSLLLPVAAQSRANPHQINMKHFRIDSEHSNAFTTWKKMGEPQQPTAEQYATLERSGQLALIEEREVEVGDDRMVSFGFELPRQGVSLLIFE